MSEQEEVFTSEDLLEIMFQLEDKILTQKNEFKKGVWIITWRDQLIKCARGKSSWGSSGAAKNAFHNHYKERITHAYAEDLLKRKSSKYGDRDLDKKYFKFFDQAQKFGILKFEQVLNQEEMNEKGNN